MWKILERLFPRPPNAAEKLLNHFDRICGTEAKYLRISDEASKPAMDVVIYQGYPTPDAITGFTTGLSHFHPPGGAHKELTISMRSSDNGWAVTCGHLALELRESCTFTCGDRINLGEPIVKSSPMSSFVVVHPLHITPQDSFIDLGIRQIELIQLVPIYKEESLWLSSGGELKLLLEALSGDVSMDPQRKAFVGSM